MKATDAVCALAALAQPSRLEVFRLLANRGDLGLCAGDISRRLKIPKPTLSFHLKELSHAGLVYSERDGRSVTYYLHIKGMRSLMAFLTDDCCRGQPELCTPAPPRTRLTPSRQQQSPAAEETTLRPLPTHLL